MSKLKKDIQWESWAVSSVDSQAAPADTGKGDEGSAGPGSEWVTDAQVGGELDVVLSAPDDHHQQVQHACSQVPDNQTVDAEDGADRGVDDVEDGHDDTEEGEEESEYEECYHCH